MPAYIVAGKCNVNATSGNREGGYMQRGSLPVGAAEGAHQRVGPDPEAACAEPFSAAVGANVASTSPAVSTLFEWRCRVQFCGIASLLFFFYLNERCIACQRHTLSQTIEGEGPTGGRADMTGVSLLSLN
jgi:hypothetical protein